MGKSICRLYVMTSFEIIEARNIFNLPKKLSILIHPKSYIHVIIKFNSGLIKLIVKIPLWKYQYLTHIFKK